MKTSNLVAKQDNTHLQLMAELYRAFDFFNVHYKSELTRPVITINTAGTRKAMGWFCKDIWMQDEKPVCEINICGEALAKGIMQTMGTLLHEMAHFKNHILGVKDNNDQQRHNMLFREQAENFGLIVAPPSDQYGWAHTDLLPETERLIKNELKPNKELFTLYRRAFNEQKKKAKKSTLTPVMIDQETKAMIKVAAEELGMSQKDFTTNAVKTYLHLPEQILEAVKFLRGKGKDLSDNQAAKIIFGMITVMDGVDAKA